MKFDAQCVISIQFLNYVNWALVNFVFWTMANSLAFSFFFLCWKSFVYFNRILRVRKFQTDDAGKSIMCSLETDKQTLVKNGGKFQNYDPLNRVKYWKEGDHKKIVRKPILLFSTWRKGKNGHLESRAILTTIEKVPRKLKSHKMASGNVIYGRSYSFENCDTNSLIKEIKTWICWDFLI